LTAVVIPSHLLLTAIVYPRPNADVKDISQRHTGNTPTGIPTASWGNLILSHQYRRVVIARHVSSRSRIPRYEMIKKYVREGFLRYHRRPLNNQLSPMEGNGNAFGKHLSHGLASRFPAGCLDVSLTSARILFSVTASKTVSCVKIYFKVLSS
jgi:hypothetical protein